MRELKFRAWDKTINTMRMNVSLDLSQDMFRGISDGVFPFASFDEIELMQFTGLKDKNRKEIYEEDILKITVYNIEQMYERGSVHQTIPGKIVYSEHFGTLGIETKDGTVGNRKIFTSFHPFTDFNIRSKEYEWEILGNGYEDPKLLEKYEKNNI